jgi:hypothetical protein
MTKPGTDGRFIFSPAQSWKRDKLGKSSFLKTACIVFVFCAATGIASAQTFTSLLGFDNTAGEFPYAGLIQGTDETCTGQRSVADLAASAISVVERFSKPPPEVR